MVLNERAQDLPVSCAAKLVSMGLEWCIGKETQHHVIIISDIILTKDKSKGLDRCMLQRENIGCALVFVACEMQDSLEMLGRQLINGLIFII